MPTLVSLALLAGGVVLVVAGAELFFEGVLAVAPRLRLAPFVVTAVLSGFELENLAVAIAANAKGLSGAAAGTFLGGTTFLALGVAGLAALIAPIRAELPRGTLLWTAAAPLPLVALSLDGWLSRLDGALLLAWFAVALTGVARTGRTLLPAVEPAATRPRRRGLVLRLVGGLGLLSVGGELLGQGLRDTVARFGVSDTLLGSTVIAASVEAEEVARVAVPNKRRRGDIAVGNLVGTVVHFVAFNAGVIALVKPLELDGATRALHLPAAAASVLALCALLSVRRGIGRPDAAGLLVLYAAYVAAAIATGL